MTLGNPINIRLPIEQQLKYESQAIEHGLPLRTYLRQRLESGDNILTELSALRKAVEQTTPFSDAGNDDSKTGIMLEILLLLRQIAQPQKVQIAQHELKRLGFDIWDGQKE